MPLFLLNVLAVSRCDRGADAASWPNKRRIFTVRRLPPLAAAIASFLLLSACAEAAPFSVPYWRGPAPPQQKHHGQKPHPAVARIIVPERGGYSYGSGTLIHVRDQFGLVVTNWHVVRDGTGPPEVVFPGGFRSRARSLKIDRTWDLAALVIWRPPVEPVPLAGRAPQPGEPLTIAGYGRGTYRQATGRCTQYVAPAMRFPFEMVELSVEARQGDSGGPIFNDRGELAGVLFGAGHGTTMGSYVGRVRGFLASVAPDLQVRPPTMLADASSAERRSHHGALDPHREQRPRAPGAVLATVEQPFPRTPRRRSETNDKMLVKKPSAGDRTAKFSVGGAIPSDQGPSSSNAGLAVAGHRGTGAVANPGPGVEEPAAPSATAGGDSESTNAERTAENTSSLAARAEPLTWREFAGDTVLSQAKTLLILCGSAAGLGLLLVALEQRG